MTYYRHFEADKSCDWIHWRGATCFQFALFDLNLHFHRDTEMTMVTLSVGLLGFGFVIDVGHWPDYEREAEALARDGMKETLRRRMKDNP